MSFKILKKVYVIVLIRVFYVGCFIDGEENPKTKEGRIMFSVYQRKSWTDFEWAYTIGHKPPFIKVILAYYTTLAKRVGTGFFASFPFVGPYGIFRGVENMYS